MSWLVAIVLALSGFAGLSLAMGKHQREIFGAKLSERENKFYRWIGWVHIGASALVCLVSFDISFGIVAFCGVATVGSIPVILLMTMKPKAMTLLCPFSRWISTKTAGVAQQD